MGYFPERPAGWSLLDRPILVRALVVLLVLGVAGVGSVLVRRQVLDVDGSRARREAAQPGAVLSSRPVDVVAGQTLYVPIYSHVYQIEGSRLPLSATLSIRNADVNRSLTVMTVLYYDAHGQMVRDYLPQPIELRPLGSTDFFVSDRNATGGTGANFLVEWVAAEPVHPPVVEAVLVGQRGVGTAAFVSKAVVIDPLPSDF